MLGKLKDAAKSYSAIRNPYRCVKMCLRPELRPAGPAGGAPPDPLEDREAGMERASGKETELEGKEGKGGGGIEIGRGSLRHWLWGARRPLDLWSTLL